MERRGSGRLTWLGAVLAMLLFGAAAATGQEEPIRFKHFTVEQGLSQSFVYTIFQDSKGLIWLGTRDGLNKFDGYAFTSYRHQPFHPNTISSSVVRSVTEDHAGALWIGTLRGGIDRFDRRSGRFTSFQHNPADPRSLGDNNVNTVMVDRHGTLWIGTRERGLDRLDNVEALFANNPRGKPARFIHYRHPDEGLPVLDCNAVYAIHEDHAGTIWFGTDSGLIRFDRNPDRFTHCRLIFPELGNGMPFEVFNITEETNGTIWVSSIDGIAAIDPRTGTQRIYQERNPSAIAIDQSGRIMFGMVDGLITLDPRTEARRLSQHDPSVRASLGSDNVITLFRDRSGSVWIGTDNGVDRIDHAPPRFSLYNTESGILNENNTRSILDAGDNRFWIGSTGLGLTLYDRGRGLVRRYSSGSPRHATTDIINVIFRSKDGTLWLGTRAGLMIFDSVHWNARYYLPRISNYPPRVSNYPPITNVWSICEDEEGILWIGTVKGLYRIDRRLGTAQRIWIPAPGRWSTTYDAVWTVKEDRRGDLWIGTPAGIARVDRRKLLFTWYRHDPADTTTLSQSEAFVIFEDRHGVIWIGTWGGGLNRFDRTTGGFRHYTIGDGMASDVIHGILEDNAGALWISTGGGISKFNPGTGSCIDFDKGDGLQGVEFNPNACCRMKDGEMFFGGLNGLNSFHPEQVTIDSSHAPIVITSFKKFDALVTTELFDGESAELAPDENYCSFEFAALVYANAERVHYAYRLDGFDNDWNYSGTRRYAAYTNLDPGEYIFRVKSTNGDGVWNDRGIAIRVHVIPPFWRTWLFRALVILALIGVAFIWFRMREQKRRDLELALEEARENERRELAAELHDGPLQDLYSTRFMLEPLSRSVIDSGTRSAITTIDDTLRRVRGSLRDVCGDLQLPYLDSGLDTAIESHAEHCRRSLPGTEIHLDLMRDDGVLSDVERQNLFRIYRSTMNNIIKHAEASRVAIRLAWDRRQLLLEVIDNGLGFHPPASLTDLLRNKHYGLLLADAHARAMGGHLEVTSIPGAGTTVRVRTER